jgi:hypothetical protein
MVLVLFRGSSFWRGRKNSPRKYANHTVVKLSEPQGYYGSRPLPSINGHFCLSYLALNSSLFSCALDPSVCDFFTGH